MIDLDLRVERRAALVRAVSAALTAGCERSVVEVRGSLASGTADQYSDIDLRWVVPDDRFTRLVEDAPELLSAVAPVVSIRSDPDLQRSGTRRLLFVRLAGVPLFWRVDLEVWAESATSIPNHDEDDRDAHGGDWSLAASAAANALGAVKALAWGRTDEARGLLERGFDRIGIAWNDDGDLRASIAALASAAGEHDEGVASFAREVCSLAEAVLRCP